MEERRLLHPTVVTELEGLSKGTMEEKPKEGDKSRGKKVMDGAK